MSVLQKLGMILESKVVQKLSLEKNVLTKKWSPKLIFLNENKKNLLMNYSLTILCQNHTFKVNFLCQKSMELFQKKNHLRISI